MPFLQFGIELLQIVNPPFSKAVIFASFAVTDKKIMRI